MKKEKKEKGLVEARILWGLKTRGKLVLMDKLYNGLLFKTENEAEIMAHPSEKTVKLSCTFREI